MNQEVRMTLSVPEPMPEENESTPIWDLVIADMRDRDQFGRSKYRGVPLQVHNGRDPLVDLYQELLDGAVYARQLIEERRITTPDGWCNVESGLPAWDQRVLVAHGGYNDTIAVAYLSSDGWKTVRGYSALTGVTHWRHLPDGPVDTTRQTGVTNGQEEAAKCGHNP